MNSNRKISLAITTYNRYNLTIESFAQVVDDHRINEIVIIDDHSLEGSYEHLKAYFNGNPKVFVGQNDSNIDCYRNKFVAVQHCHNDFCIVLDSDNILTTEYIDTLYKLPRWSKSISYCPTFAKPHFDYREFAGLVIARKEVKNYIDSVMFFTALNTMNFFISVDKYADVWDGSIDPVTADSMYFNYCWLKKGNKMHFVPGLEYEHRIFHDSHFQNNRHRTGEIERNVETLLRLL